jgi:inosine-uridine nucleoside N-ribohydrolase
LQTKLREKCPHGSLILLGLLAALALPLNARTQVASGRGPAPAKPELVIFDTDIGDDIDDVFALGLALSSPEFKIVGITSAWGDTALRSRMIDRVLCETGRSDIPVLTGVATHRKDAAEFSQAPWAKAGLPHKAHGSDDAVAFILEQARTHPGEITLIAVAPLTNIGAAIDRDPAAFRKLKRVVLMGGSVLRGYDADNAPGVATKPMAEYNIAMDPPAAQKLFQSGVPIYMMPLDSTQIAFDSQRSAEFAAISTPLTDAIEVLTAEWSHVTKRTAPTLFDPVAVAYAVDATTCPTTPEHIEVDAKGYTRSSDGPPNAQACLKAQPEAFFALAMPRLTQQKMAGTKACVTR